MQAYFPIKQSLFDLLVINAVSNDTAANISSRMDGNILTHNVTGNGEIDIITLSDIDGNRITLHRVVSSEGDDE